jgi:biopolymer transport protein ExbD
MDSTSTPASSTSTKTKWRLALLAAVVAVVLLPPLFMLVARAVSQPPVMQVATPVGTASAPVGAPTGALTILLGNGKQLYYYFGAATPPTAAGLHAVAPGQPLRQVIKTWQQRGQATIFIKPVAQSNYKALVAILDEMNRDGQRSYAMVNATDADRQLLPASERQ